VPAKKVAQSSVASSTDFQGRARQRELRKRWPSLLDEALKRPNRGTFITPSFYLSHQQRQIERVSEVEASEFTRGHFCRVKVSALDRALKAAVCCPLRRHN
jgi:hypothetical protein